MMSASSSRHGILVWIASLPAIVINVEAWQNLGTTRITQPPIKGASTSHRKMVNCDQANAAQSVWSPRSCHWIDEDFFQKEVANQVGSDLHGSLEKASSNNYDDEMKTPTITTSHCNKDGDVIALQVESSLSEQDAATVQTLARCIREHIGDSNFQHRSFGEDKGGNDCTYLAPLLQVFCPDIAQKVVEIVRLVWESSGWGEMNRPDPLSLGIRTSEHLAYTSSGWKSLEAHKDNDSVYTIMISLADPDDYEGGDFFVQNSMFESTDIKPRRLSAVAFLSDTTHGVRPITSGHRETFVTELWMNDDAPLGLNRPTPEEWEAYLDKKERDS